MVAEAFRLSSHPVALKKQFEKGTHANVLSSKESKESDDMDELMYQLFFFILT